jgi:2-keto-4-pentenoate hydratase/2-oxohepta-3-ene-1,7-dioic acid hydratase in catechol pathway
MRLALYQDSGGGQRVGVGVAAEAGRVIPTPWRSFDELFAEPDPLGAAQAFRPDPATAVTPDRLLAPVVGRPQVIGTGGNYADHAAEAIQAIQVSEPVFMPFLWGAIIDPDDEIVIPSPETLTDYEVKLSVVIGRTARGLTGVGYFRSPQEFMHPGDVITAEVTGVGRLVNRVVAGW